MTRQMAGYRLTRRLAQPSEQDYVLLCTNAAGDQKLAAWTTKAAHGTVVELSSAEAGKFGGVEQDGQSFELKIETGRRGLVLRLTPSLQYIGLGRITAK